MPSDESKGNQLDAIGSLAQRQLDNTVSTTQPAAAWTDGRGLPAAGGGHPDRTYRVVGEHCGRDEGARRTHRRREKIKK